MRSSHLRRRMLCRCHLKLLSLFPLDSILLGSVNLQLRLWPCLMCLLCLLWLRWLLWLLCKWWLLWLQWLLGLRWLLWLRWLPLLLW